jgi:MinD-like ATPase involved in chromosome partitioning or flagellar assembly
MPGTVVTFYSYKGGVGRSFALANVAVILAQWGYRVLAVDWDIEAPGLASYFTDYASHFSAGVLDFLKDCESDKPRNWDAYATELQIPDVSEPVYLMPASGSNLTDYTARLHSLDWDDLYEKHDFSARLENLRANWIDLFDVILIDSRTGITDFIGVTTAQLPDILVFFFTANNQSLDGCCDVVRRTMEARRKLPIDRPAILPLPVPARFDQKEEYDRAIFWRSTFTRKLEKFYEVWAPKDLDYVQLVDLYQRP